MKKFMFAFAAVAAGFASQTSNAAIAPATPYKSLDSSLATTDPHRIRTDGLVSVVDEKGDAFEFVLKRSTETGTMMAYHRSHSSHSSHASHRSHYSGR